MPFTWINDAKCTLDLSEGRLGQVDVAGLDPAIDSINISRNDLRTLPDWLFSLRNLRSLVARSNRLGVVPTAIEKLRGLQYLDLSENKLEALPDSVSRLAGLVMLSMDANNLKRLPEGIGALSALRELTVRDNQLTSLPQSLSRLRALGYLIADNNRLEELPEELVELCGLHTLDVAGNMLAALPQGIGSLGALRRLSLTGNRLSCLPDGLCDLRALELLFAEDNRLESLPSRFNELGALVRLELAGNRISAFPAEGIANLTKLKILNLVGNRIRSLPTGVSALPELTDVQMLEGQPKNIPIENLECEWDVFISHASEDKVKVVEPLAALLERAGIRVWLDAWELRVGDGIRQSIDEGLRRSRFGLLLLSPAYMNRYWTTGEFEALTALEAAKKLHLLPVWHEVTQEEVLRFSPFLAGRKAADTKDSVESVATMVTDAIFYRLYALGAEEVSPVPRLAQILHNRLEPVLVRDFLLQHQNLLEALVGLGNELLRCEPVGEDGIIVSQALFSLGCVEHTTVWFYPTHTIGFPLEIQRTVEARLDQSQPRRLARDAPAAEAKRTGGRVEQYWQRQKLKPVFSSLVLTGRRISLSAEDQERMLELNERRERDRFRIRTYDHLLDAAIASRDTGRRRRGVR